VSDCNQHAAWSTESAVLMNTSFQELDPISDHFALGRAFGHTGLASSLLTLALAAMHAQTEERPVLAASVADPIERSLAVLKPWQVSPT
ncbi:MAG: hypothetical protein H6R19_3479, partial [Proteobacteria bacterium]|nr:hypothetical protein [Pseudomonadota bacterium]